MKRQIHLKPSERKTKLQFSWNNWDKVPSDYSLIYENDVKNYIWSFYILQATFAASCCLFAAYKLQALLDMSSDRDLQMMFLCCGMLLASIAYLNIIATRTCIRIYHNSESGQFIAVRRTVFGRLQKVAYTTSDVTVYKKESDDTKMQILIKVKGKKYRLASSDFLSPIYFNMHFHGTSHQYWWSWCQESLMLVSAYPFLTSGWDAPDLKNVCTGLVTRQHSHINVECLYEHVPQSPSRSDPLTIIRITMNCKIWKITPEHSSLS